MHCNFIDISSWSSYKLDKHQTLWTNLVEQEKEMLVMCVSWSSNERFKEKDNLLAGTVELMHSKIYKNVLSSEYL